MTSQKDQIQALISDIDGVLQKTTPRLPWVMSGEVTQQRQTLERVRNYLVALQRRMAIQDGYGQLPARPDLLAHDISYQSGSAEIADAPPQGTDPQAAQQLLQTVVQEMSYLRTNLMQPLQADLETLQHQRASLIQEIQQLENQRLEAQQQSHGALPPNQQQMITDFLQALMGRLQETLPQQVAQSLKGSNQPSLPYQSNPALVASPGSYPPAADGLQLSQNADPLILHLDSTLKVIFESLERNVQAYQESLSQGLDRMHGLGQQGEMMFTALINHLAQRMGREASNYLQSSQQVVEMGTAQIANETAPTPVPAPAKPDVAKPAVTASTAEVSGGSGVERSPTNLTLPYPGTEMPLAGVSESAATKPTVQPSPTTPSVDAEIDAWLKSASALGGEAPAPSPVNLDLPGLSLTDLDLNQIDAEDIDALLEMEAGTAADYLASEPSAASSTFAETFPASEGDTEDIDAALKLLEQLSSDLDESSTPSLEDAEAEIDRMLSHASAEEEPAPEVFDDARDELDEFYESLFGDGTEPVADTTAVAVEADSAIAPPTSESEPPTPEVADDPTLGWDLSTHELVSEPETITPGAELLEESAPPIITSPVEPEPATATSEPSVATLSDLLEEPATPAPELQLSAQEGGAIAPGNEISTLSDLFEDVQSPQDFFPQATGTSTTPELFQGWVEPTQESETLQPTDSADLQLDLSRDSDDTYTPASPDEDLLPTDVSAPAADQGLWVDDITLSSLSEDLSSLEGLVEPSASPTQFETVTTDQPTHWDAAPPAASEPSLEDLATSLTGEPAAPAPGSEAAPAPETANAFTLEGMDDLFADLPAAPSVTPAPPPIAPAPNEPPPFTLEGMGDLFADLSAPPTVNPISPPGIASSYTDASPGTFQEAPEPPAAEPSPAALPLTDPLVPFTLEGMDDLFAEEPAAVPSTPPETVTPEALSNSQTPLFNLEGMEDLFVDAPPVDASASDLGNSPTLPESLNLEGVDTLFADANPSAVAETVHPDQISQFTLEQVGDVLMEVPVGAMVEQPAAQPSFQQPNAFTLEQMGDVLMEVPLGDPQGFEFTNVDALETAIAGDPSASQDIFSELTLDQAFESLMGAPEPSSTEAETLGTDPQAIEKKKRAT